MQSTAVDFTCDRISPVRSPQLPSSTSLDQTPLSADLTAALSALRTPIAVTTTTTIPNFPIFPFSDPSFFALTQQLNNLTSLPKFPLAPFITPIVSTIPTTIATPIPKRTQLEPTPASPQSCTSTVISSSPQASPHRKQAAPIPNEKKDEAYYERRRKNNDAAKRSRDARRQKEEAVAARAALLEQENIQLRSQVALLQKETAKLHLLLFSQTKPFDSNNPLAHLKTDQANNGVESGKSFSVEHLPS
ncbi:unnamed protein product [Dracunculus medinensis]|uniref:BZIP domain-containing protein n=1 Tax=Dracunculus medinensis TaxID=318479 RepID=A0A0N4U5M5_DRAME|nr:unnamed protein product [Dracunculus medinensis]